MAEKTFLDELELLVRSRYPIIWIETWEEKRAIRLIRKLSQTLNKHLYEWDCLAGVSGENKHVPDTNKPEAALEHVRNSPENAIFVFSDFHPYLSDQMPSVVRRLRATGFELKRSFKTLIIVSPVATIPPELDKQISVLDLPLPSTDELKSLLVASLESVKKNPKLEVDLDKQMVESISRAAGGLTMAEAEHLFMKAAVSDRRFGPEDLSMILKEKKQILRKSGVLEYFDTDKTMMDVGGLVRLKKWLGSRQKAFTDKARDFGLPQPKGLLLLGVQGCGKSLVAKAVASSWQLPLLRLDFGSLFSSYIGSTEANMRKAIKVAETISPVVLWLDEIEKGLSGLQSSGAVDAGVTARIFSSFLLWMQEKTSPVFIVATANDVSSLPPELLRKGRFDEIFFVDLPEEKERKEIISIHLKKKKRAPQEFDIATLVEATEGFSGAEIEQVVIDALYTAFDEGKQLSQLHLESAAREMIPLSTTMKEKVQSLRKWASTRAVSAT